MPIDELPIDELPSNELPRDDLPANELSAERLTSALFGRPACVACDSRAGPLCGSCRTLLRPPPSLPPVAGLATCHALFDYAGPGRAAITALKYRNQRALLGELAAVLARLAPPAVDHVVWAPTSARRRRQRGFDQAELLARRVARLIDRPIGPRLTRRGGPQTGRSRSERLTAGDGNVGVGNRRRRSPGGAVLLIDDVVTTGATLQRCATALAEVGFGPVHGRVLAATAPIRRPSGPARR